MSYGSPAHHVGSYLGGGQMIHAPTTGDVARVASVTGPGTPTYGRSRGTGWVAGATSAASSAVQTAASTVGWSLGLGDAGERIVSWATRALFVVLGLSLVGVGIARAAGAGGKE